MLSKLLSKGIPEGYERVALAAALDYGSLITIGDSEVAKIAPNYAYNMIDFIAKTDTIEIQKFTKWQAKYYPLEANIGLVWGAPATIFWKIQRGPVFWYDIFKDRKMDIDDFHWFFVSIETLADMQEWMKTQGFTDMHISNLAIDMGWVVNSFTTEYNDNVDEIMAYLTGFIHLVNILVSGDPWEEVNVEGRTVYAGDITNPDWQWNHFTETGWIYGTCREDTTAEVMLAKSIGIACHHGFIYAKSEDESDYTHTLVHYFNPIDNMIRTTPCQVNFHSTTGHENSPPVSHDGYIQIPLNNFYSSKGFGFWNTFYHRSSKTSHMIYANGFPVGYILRTSNQRQSMLNGPLW